METKEYNNTSIKILFIKGGLQMRHRKRNLIIKMVILAIMVVTFIATTAMAAEDYTTKAYVKVKTCLNLRELPTTESVIIGKLQPGELVKLYGDIETESWVKVVTEDGKDGYVSSQYLAIPRFNQRDYDVISVAVITAGNSSENRNFNLAKACESINGMVLLSGDEFNWYGENGVGEASLERGYKEATILQNGKYVMGQGGGVCQVSTALYNCIYKLGIVPTEHHHHSIPSSYVEEGMDATVAYSNNKDYMLNFVFTNTLEDTLIFEAHAEGPQVVIVAYTER